MSKTNKIMGAISLIAKFDTMEDDKQIDNMICHAISQGIDIENYTEEDYIEQVG